jgi:hypothetical protein
METPKEIMVNGLPRRVLKQKPSATDTAIVLCDISNDNSYTPFAVWRAYISPITGEWGVECGDYARTLSEAVGYFEERV